MPQIVEYNAPQGIGLNPTEVGIESTAAAARRVNAAFSETAQVKEEAGRRIGAGIREAGDAAVQYMTHQEVSRAAASFAKFKLGEIQNWNQQSEKADPNDPTVGGKYMEGLEGRLQQFQQGFLTEGGQKWADAQVISFRDHMAKTTASDMAAHAGNAAAINQRSLANTLSNTVYLNPTPEGIKDAFGTLDSTTETLIANNPNLRNSGKADELRYRLSQSTKEAIVKSAVMGYIKKTGEIPPWASNAEYSGYITLPEMKQFQQAERYYTNLNRSEARYEKQQRDYDNKLDFNTKINELESKTYPKTVGERATLPEDYWDKMRDLSNHPGAALEPGRLASAMSLGNAISNRLNKPEPAADTSIRETRRIIKLMNATDDSRLEGQDALKVINESYDKELLTTKDWNMLRKDASDRDPDSMALGRERGEFFKRFGASIDPTFGATAEGGQKQYFAEQEARRQEDSLRRQGKDPHLVYDPRSEYYFGKPENVARFKASLQDLMRGVNAQPPGPPPKDFPDAKWDAGVGAYVVVRDGKRYPLIKN